MNEQANSQISTTPKWWKEQIVYQIYPRSFCDSTGNGIGDLRGIISKLDYVQSLGVNSVWVNPIYASPNDDNGYDISDYRAIMQEFGTMGDFHDLIAGLQQRNMKFVMDLVVNHTSDEHYWFEQSRSARDNPYRDYYHWWPAENGVPPHRFSFFDEKGEAWQYDTKTNAYYLHYFSVKQPDLNWENPKVRQEVYDIMRFWIEKGVNGFRLDAFQFVSKDTSFPDLPEHYSKDMTQVIKHHGMGPYLHEYLQEMYTEILSQHDIFAVSEGAGSGVNDAHDLVDENRNELQMVYHFEAVEIGNHIDRRHNLAQFKDVHTRWETSFAEQGWLSVFLANHDSPRMLSKFGDDRPQFRRASASLLNTFLLTMRGTPYCYFGDELGMSNIYFDTIDEYQDISARNGYKNAISKDEDIAKYMQNLSMFSRDNSRTPMQWNSKDKAGFTSGTPWLTVNPNYLEVNVAAQEDQADSVLNHFRRLTSLRKAHPLLVYGEYQILEQAHEAIYMYTRRMNGQTILVILNFCDIEQKITLPIGFENIRVLINNQAKVQQQNSAVLLQPYQALVLADFT